MTKEIALETFYEKYKELGESKRYIFSRISNKLLSDNFIYGQILNDKDDYYKALELYDILSAYFNIIGFDIINDDNYKIIYLYTTEDKNRVHFKKLETIILLILRLMYKRANLEISSETNINISISSFIEEINKTGIYRTDYSNTNLQNALKTLKRYKLIDVNFADFNENSAIKIYPTILYVVKTDDINMLLDRINSYIDLVGDEDEVSED